jgi:predicted amidohydrolase YtcJ
MVLSGGKVYPRAGSPTAVSGIVVGGGKVEQQLETVSVPSGPAARIDLQGLVVLPGFTDAHIHLEKYARQLQRLDCETATRDECLRRVQARAQQIPPGDWILGHGWNQNDWDRFGTAADLDVVAPRHPVYLTAKSLHAGWANSRALLQVGVSASTVDPPGGVLQRDPAGNPTGILLEGAMEMLARALPNPTRETTLSEIQRAQDRLWRMGITSVHDFDGATCFHALQSLLERGDLGLRVLKSIPGELLPQAADLGLRSGFGNDWLRLGHMKLFADGALGPRTAAMLAPYEGTQTDVGILLLDREAILEAGIRAGEAGLPLAIHAIGDRANHEALEGLAAVRRHEVGRGWPQRRHRIEHLQLLHPEDVQRPAELGLVASMQPIHATSDMLMADRHWGSRVGSSYAWESQQRAGATLAFGSDAPVESPNPFFGLHAAVTRRRLDGSPSPEGWTPHQRLAVHEALQAYTEGPAFAAGTEGRQGRLEPGFAADLIVLDQDPLTCDAEELPRIQVLGTMVGGRWAFRDF